MVPIVSAFVVLVILMIITLVLSAWYLAWVRASPSTTENLTGIATAFFHEDDYTHEFYRGDHGVMHPSPGLGNVIAKIVYRYLVHKSNGKTFKYEQGDIPEKDWKGMSGLEEIFPKMKMTVPFSKPTSMPDLKPSHDAYKSYPHDIKFFQPFKSEIMDLMGTKDIPRSTKYDVIVHVRLDDVDSYNFMSPMPRSWYKEVFTAIAEKKDRILLVCRKPNKPFLSAALRAVQDGMKDAGAGTGTIDIQSANVADDFLVLLTAPVLVLSASTFSFWSAFLNPNVTSVHLPYFGVMSDDAVVSAVRSTTWQSMSGGKPRIMIHRMAKGFTPIRSEEQLQR